MQDIVYLKLTNGDELFAERIGEEGNQILLSDVMIMETIQADADLKYLFMTRYTQYGDLHSIALDKSCVIFVHEASEIVKRHYQVSVQYAQQVTDNRFLDGIADATNFISLVLAKKNQKQVETDSFETVKDKVLGTFESDSNTKH